ncbi:zona pellucida sperm-binding protein 3-like [Colossoma macropomum]|uniref:zona pellucida sperm-binding protein 3-like n=1 Tax=Colossoma macropomum TaxID=42526 RepID=UPI001863F6B4|nr:zona pellucida sperm-binding protein 3-like [Colossoma macropomum]
MGLRQNGLGGLMLLVFGVCNAQIPGRRMRTQLKNLVGAPPHQLQAASVRGPVQDPLKVQFKQVLQGPVKKLTWHFPQPSEMPKQPPVQFELRQPVQAYSVAAECGESMVHVEVKRDFFGTGELINPSAITLGGCATSGEDPAAQVLIFESELQICNSVLMMTEDELVYTFTLHYATETSAETPVVRTSGAVVGIECHYPRRYNVSSNALLPAWIPYAATLTAEERLVFALRLMTDDWQFERPSNQYFLGDLINIEASVMQYNHVPLRIFVDSCVATAVPDMNATPRYSFIENYGCLVDAKLTGSTSCFMPRVQGDKLQFQLEAFVFQQQSSGLIYFMCFLKATAASAPTDAVHKACSFTANRWTTADDDDRVCGCCDASCGLRGGGNVSPLAGPQWEGNFTLGPVFVGEKAPIRQ